MSLTIYNFSLIQIYLNITFLKLISTKAIHVSITIISFFIIKLYNHVFIFSFFFDFEIVQGTRKIGGTENLYNNYSDNDNEYRLMIISLTNPKILNGHIYHDFRTP